MPHVQEQPRQESARLAEQEPDEVPGAGTGSGRRQELAQDQARPTAGAGTGPGRGHAAAPYDDRPGEKKPLARCLEPE